MICPKCEHQQKDSTVCEYCGIYFEKYQQAQQRNKQLLQQREATELENIDKNAYFLIKIVIILSLISFISYIFLKKESADLSISPIAEQKPLERTNKFFGIKEKLYQSHYPRNEIELSRNATVFIKTGWGTFGSGFIISEDCLVITNRHVMEMNLEKEISRKKSDPKLRQALVKDAIQKRIELRKLMVHYQKMLMRHGKTPESEKLAIEIEQKSQEIDALPDKYEQDLVEQVESVKREGDAQGFDVSLVDGTTFKIYEIEFSELYDLALFQLPEDGCPYLKLNADDNLPQGTPLYTIGNPSGLEYTVTSGIFSGYRGQGENRFIQTDAPINPGNSGGPLITEDGNLVGINTLILKGTQGIGFAIPANIIEQEFGSVVSYDN